MYTRFSTARNFVQTSEPTLVNACFINQRRSSLSFWWGDMRYAKGIIKKHDALFVIAIKAQNTLVETGWIDPPPFVFIGFQIDN